MAAQEYQLDKLAAQVNSVLNGAVVANASQIWSEAQKQQARDNIGASAAGTGLQIIAHFDTLAELEAAVPNPTPGEAYSVGESVPYSLYLFDFGGNTWRDYGAIRSEDISARIVQNAVVPVSAWEEDEPLPIFPDFPYRAAVELAEVTEDDFPIVVFSPTDAGSGNFCPVAYTFDGKVEIFAKSIPTATVTLPAVTFIVFGDGSGGGTGDHTALINRDASEQHPMSSITGLQQTTKGQQRQINALKNLLEGVAYSTEADITAAYAKKVPSGAQAVSVNSIGGHSEVVDGEIVSAEVTDVICLGKNLVDINANNIVKRSVQTPTGTANRWGVIFNVPVDGTYYFSTDNASNSIGTCKKIADGVYERIYSFMTGGVMSLSAGEHFLSVTHTSSETTSKDFLLSSGAMVEYGSSATDYAPYRGEVDRLTLPAELLAYLADKGYGEAPADGAGNTLDLGNKTYTQLGSYVNGAWVALAEPVVYDVSGYLPGAVDLLSVESGGMLTFRQSGDTELTVPQSLVWAIKNSEVTA